MTEDIKTNIYQIQLIDNVLRSFSVTSLHTSMIAETLLNDPHLPDVSDNLKATATLTVTSADNPLNSSSSNVQSNN